MSLNLLEETIVHLAEENLEWPEFKPPIRVYRYMDIHVERDRPCRNGLGACYIKTEGNYKRAKAYGCKCKLYKCNQCTNCVPYEESVIALAQEELKWTLSFPPIYLEYYPLLQIVQYEECQGNGFCLGYKRGQLYRPKGAACFCTPIPCLNCGEMEIKHILDDFEGQCSDCFNLATTDTKRYENKRTRLYCDICLTVLNPIYHRKDYKTSKHPWVKAHMHQKCWMKDELEMMGFRLDVYCDCDDDFCNKH